MTHRLETRLRKLELAKMGPERLHIVAGYTDAEMDAALSRLRKTTTINPNDLVVRVQRFGSAA
jgi:hypothetical protein